MAILKLITKYVKMMTKKVIDYLFYTPINFSHLGFRSKFSAMCLIILGLTLLGYQLINAFFFILYHLLGIEAML